MYQRFEVVQNLPKRGEKSVDARRKSKINRSMWKRESNGDWERVRGQRPEVREQSRVRGKFAFPVHDE